MGAPGERLGNRPQAGCNEADSVEPTEAELMPETDQKEDLPVSRLRAQASETSRRAAIGSRIRRKGEIEDIMLRKALQEFYHRGMVGEQARGGQTGASSMRRVSPSSQTKDKFSMMST